MGSRTQRGRSPGFARSVPACRARSVEAIIAHELAHIACHDFLVNCLQSVVEVLLFYHPGVWWLSSRIRHERELCCDDVAAESGGDRVLYARALLMLEESRQTLAIAATGGNLSARIARLVQPAPVRAAAPVLAVALSACVVAGLFAASFVSAQESRMVSSTTVAAGTAPAANETERRIQYADQRFGDGDRRGSTTDGGRLYIELGPPDEIETHRSPTREAWRYRNGRQYEFRGDHYDLVGVSGAPRDESGSIEVRTRTAAGDSLTVTSPQIEYPAVARSARVEGIVRLRIRIDKEGRASDITVIQGHPLLVPAAVSAARRSLYKGQESPGAADGTSATSDYIFTLPE